MSATSEQIMIRRQYAIYRKQETEKKKRLLKEEEAETKQARKDLELKHRGDVHYINEAYGQAMEELKEKEFAELEATRK